MTKAEHERRATDQDHEDRDHGFVHQEQQYDSLTQTCIDAFNQVSGALPAMVGAQSLTLELRCRKGKYPPFTSFVNIYNHLQAHPEGIDKIAQDANSFHQKVNEIRVRRGEQPLRVDLNLMRDKVQSILEQEVQIVRDALTFFEREQVQSVDNALEELISYHGVSQHFDLDNISAVMQGAGRAGRAGAGDPDAVTLELYRRIESRRTGRVLPILNDPDQDYY